jgi:hypothetical protein
MDLKHGVPNPIASWKYDKMFSDKFLIEIKQLLGLHLIIESPIKEDMHHNTDLMVLLMKDIRVCCRIRRHHYYEKYHHQFTIRKSRQSGNDSELTKLIEGWGDYLFYGFSNDKEVSLFHWTLCDLSVFRVWFGRQLYLSQKGEMPGIIKRNIDNSSDFIAFNLIDLPDKFIIAQSEDSNGEKEVLGEPK